VAVPVVSSRSLPVHLRGSLLRTKWKEKRTCGGREKLRRLRGNGGLHVTFSGAKSEIAGAISEIAIPYTNDVSARDCTSCFCPISVPRPSPSPSAVFTSISRVRWGTRINSSGSVLAAWLRGKSGNR